MKRRIFVERLVAIAATAWLGLAAPVQAEDDVVYGRQLMTDQEAAEYRARMRTLQTEQEREAYRLEHHRQMQERARERGVTLPDEPGAYGRGMGSQGMGGQGMGRGAQGGGRRMGPP